MRAENIDFLTTQIITYLGNKRLLLKDIQNEIELIKNELNSQKLVCADLFSGSGIVARMLKKHSKVLIVNDLEEYSKLINDCYLTNFKDFSQKKYTQYKTEILQKSKNKIRGIISCNYAPNDDTNIQIGERVFYTKENAQLIDTYRQLIDDVVQDTQMKKFFLAPLITEASVHVNTGGIFKGFYKDKNTGIGCFGGSGKHALSRIFGKIELKEPVFSNFNSEVIIYKNDINLLAKQLKNIDIAYLDPPYNQHPYGSNYFMLNLIIKNKLDVQISKISGITQDWNRSVFNKINLALKSMEEVIKNIDAKFVIISYNSDGFISFNQMNMMLKKYGKLKTIEIKYNTFKASRNLNNRNIHIYEYLFILKKT